MSEPMTAGRFYGTLFIAGVMFLTIYAVTGAIYNEMHQHNSVRIEQGERQ